MSSREIQKPIAGLAGVQEAGVVGVDSDYTEQELFVNMVDDPFLDVRLPR